MTESFEDILARSDALQSDFSKEEDSVQTHNEGRQHPMNGNTKGDEPAEKPYAVALPSAPVTCERIPYVPQPDDPLIDAGTARVNVAASVDSPNGTDGWAQRHKDKTVRPLHHVPQQWPSDV